MTRRRPFGITLLAILGGIAAVVAAYHTLQYLHILPITLGPVRFFTFDLLGAVLFGVSTAIWIWVAYSLWTLRPAGRLFVIFLSALNLLLAAFAIIGQSTFQAMLPEIIINGIILIYALTPGVAEAFSEEWQGAPVVGAPAAGTTANVAPVPTTGGAAVEATEEEVSTATAETEPYHETASEMKPEAEDLESPHYSTSETDTSAPDTSEPDTSTSEKDDQPPFPAEPEAASPASGETASGDISMRPVEEQSVESLPPAVAPSRKILVEVLEGIGPTYGAQLKAIGIVYASDLLEAGASRRGREEIAQKTGITNTLILKWVNMADLMRISGIGEEFSELLEAAGVDSVKELRNRNPENLHLAMLQVAQKRKMVRRTPRLYEVRSWVDQAKHLEPVITY